MILNERQYKISNKAVRDFVLALDKLLSEDTSSPKIKIQVQALKADIKKLKNEISEYEFIRSGKLEELEFSSLQELPTALIRARVARKLTQKALAEAIGLKEQQIQRYESSNYSTASFARIQQIAKALNISVKEKVVLNISI